MRNQLCFFPYEGFPYVPNYIQITSEHCDNSRKFSKVLPKHKPLWSENSSIDIDGIIEISSMMLCLYLFIRKQQQQQKQTNKQKTFEDSRLLAPPWSGPV